MPFLRLAVAAAALALLPACGTAHTARWTFGMSSCFDQPTPEAEAIGWRAFVGAPVILGGVAFDAATWPIQLVFGVWPMWGPHSRHLMPPNVHEKPPKPDPL